jgi:KipI family sensor histidine kinase inhibitor
MSDARDAASPEQPARGFPRLRRAGLSGLLVSFGDRLTEPANRAALAFRAAIEAEDWLEVEETTSSLVSTFLRFDPHAQMEARLTRLMTARNWYAAPLPHGRRHWRIPTVWGGDLAPQLAEAAALAGLDEAAARAELSGTRVRVLTIGFAPGQPYLGELPEHWNLPRQTALNPQVPAGALVLAIRQLTLFTSANPTGWRHVGQVAFRLFRPDAENPFPLRPGDEVTFTDTPREAWERMRAADPDNAGATWEAIG